MKTANIAEAKAHFTALLAEVEAGEEVIITRRGKPIADRSGARGSVAGV